MQEIFTRICPTCGNKLVHKTKHSLDASILNKSVCKRCHNNKKLKNNCEILLNESLESYYWLGFIFADGHINTKNYSVNVTIHNQDLNHLLKLKKYLNIENMFIYNDRNQSGISFGNKEVINNIINKYDINSNKTHYPPNISGIIGDKLKAFIIGFIDGDGCISNQSGRKVMRITFRVHSNWLTNMRYMFNRGYISNDGYCTVAIGKMSEILDYKDFIISNNIPALERKWDKILIKHNSETER